MDPNALERVRVALVFAHDKAQNVLLSDQSEYGFGLVDGLFLALQLIHEEQGN